jgi:hypothetical protein
MSLIPGVKEFQWEMSKVTDESWRYQYHLILIMIFIISQKNYRLLRPNGRITFVMGDTRRDKLYQAVSFQTMITYIKSGFEVEELVGVIL